MKPVTGNQFHETLLHIDFAWWALREDEYHTYLHSMLCENHQKEFDYVGDRERNLTVSYTHLTLPTNREV